MSQNELESSKNWYKRGKTYRAKTMDALKSLYAGGTPATLESQPETPWEGTPPGTEPKGIKRKESQNVQKSSENVCAEESKTHRSKQ